MYLNSFTRFESTFPIFPQVNAEDQKILDSFTITQIKHGQFSIEDLPENISATIDKNIKDAGGKPGEDAILLFYFHRAVLFLLSIFVRILYRFVRFLSNGQLHYLHFCQMLKKKKNYMCPRYYPTKNKSLRYVDQIDQSIIMLMTKQQASSDNSYTCFDL